MQKVCLIIATIGVLIGSLLPGGRAQHPTNSGLIRRPVGEASAPQTHAAVHSDTIEIRRDPSGHFYADVEINGMPVRMLVDTGATTIALSRSDAQKVGLAFSAVAFPVVGRGADGDVRGERILLERLRLGPQVAEAVPAIVLDSGNLSLLGQSFLKQFKTIQIREDLMVLQ